MLLNTICTLTLMNAHIRGEVRVALACQDLNQHELAECLVISKQYLNSYMNGKAGNFPHLWMNVFEKPELELIV